MTFQFLNKHFLSIESREIFVGFLYSSAIPILPPTWLTEIIVVMQSVAMRMVKIREKEKKEMIEKRRENEKKEKG